MKENFSEVEKFARRHTIETLTVIAIAVAALSAWAHFFVGTLGWSMIFMAAGAVVGIFFPTHIDKGIKMIYSFSSGDNKMTEVIAEGVKIAIALFLPFIYFCFLGMMAGTSYHYYTRYIQSGRKGNKAA
jgi:hypothetical protein